MQLDKAFVAAQLSSENSIGGQDSPFDNRLMRPSMRPLELPGEGNMAAVLLLIFVDAETGSPNIVLTRRRPDLNSHAGQISLPGGRQDSDETLKRTAIREAVEEIGVDDAELEVLGSLSKVYVPPSDFTIQPFVGWYGKSEFIPSEAEVAEIIYMPIAKLLDRSSLVKGPIQTENGQITTSFYELSGHQVWGATAKILYELGLRLTAAE